MKVKFGIVGPGGISEKFMFASKFCDNLEVVAVASRSLDRAKAYCEKYEIEKAFGSYEEMSKYDGIDAIYLSTPHSNHYEIAKMFLEAGKSVLCEKPMVLTSAHARELSEIALANKVTLMEAMWTRFVPGVTKAHEWVDAGKIGNVKLIEANFSGANKYNPESRLFKKELAGGCMFDVGVYVIAFAMDFAGAKLVDKQILATYAPTGVDNQNIINLKFENDVLASLQCGFTCAVSDLGFIYGDNGNYIKLPRFWGSSKAYLCDRSGAVLEEFDEGYEWHYEGFKYQMRHFADLVLNGTLESPRIPHADTIACAEVMENIY